MNRRTAAIATVSLLLLAALVTAGCSSSSSAGGSSTGAAKPVAKTIELTAGDNGSTVDAAVGSTLVVKLSANPTTGYTWSTDGDLPPMVSQEGTATYEASSTAIGSGGISTMKYNVVKVGDGDLKLKYWRTFESTVPPVATFQVTLKVK
jgi:inhibitor of cysteine peptidase